MELREDADINISILRVTESIRTLEQVRSRMPGRSVADIQRDYFNAVAEAESKLRSYFLWDDLLEDLYSKRYWQIGRLNDWPRPEELVANECESQIRRLSAARTRLEDWRKLGEKEGTLVVLDTNAYMHGNQVTHIDWLRELGAKRVRIIMPIRVLTELDNNKYAGDFTRKRAHAALKPFPALLEEIQEKGYADLRKNVTLEILFDDRGHIPEPNPDDEIIARSVFLKQVTQRDVTLVTMDYSAQARAMSRGLRAHELSTENRKPSGA
ncbi:PIN domain-containing protein [Actinomadura sp. K4S16]|uniref:PIN domain-containing protein n=1 Tax=Actinomadura sp. K4S16 TaxID=1316147 RepID=UPI001F488500|nr:PIN domain-containing protein [Actinomadura sp. K4S16]